MNETELKKRTKDFALRGLKLIDSLPDTRSGRILAGQLGRSCTSVGANYRAACRSRSKAEMISKLSVVEEEADESEFWMELIEAYGLRSARQVSALKKEAHELTAIMVASRRTLQKRAAESKIENPKSKIR
ncbi:four helix bundle protein [Actomonas aquatica]|uniref:Four helix bundle protein n=1 Tax=Actomonas aquatica TaxID=2866162 RepID=A0ABZ1CH28_9BACT|nr:four helix bundle protein [Opitutus sp. WL0086]WRQ89889.1 four helix bundle protein [Opitutus sp. WL0086]